VVSPQGSVVVGRRFARFSAAGLKRDGSIRLPAKPAPRFTCRPALHAGEANAVKSPASIAAVGTCAIWSAGITRA